MGLRKMLGIKQKPTPANLASTANYTGLDSDGSRGYALYNGSTTTFGTTTTMATDVSRSTYSPLKPIPEMYPALHQRMMHHQNNPVTQSHRPAMSAQRPAAQPLLFPEPTTTTRGYSGGGNSSKSKGNSFDTTGTGSSSGASSSGRRSSIMHQQSPNTSGGSVVGPGDFPEPQITSADVRRCTKLLRRMFEIHLEMWSLSSSYEPNQPLRLEKKVQLDAILADIRNIVNTWNSMPPSMWTDDELEEIKWIAQTLNG
ncbi:hypothetical protein B0T17DRAFT_513065 [Bombardia bombarda]|uniref:Uncharacterized protein n=1 Tax=Bombardia bombarda TaxID=252184 RepID=A0AA39XI62_9PEZI|nr:hypothetical protein B0T17DRAFT_513065 [Bombardia bombarda]